MYNSSKYICECLDSLNVFFNDNKYEIIIIDDGSKDNSCNLCEEYIKKFNNIFLFKIENHGVSYARNYGIKETKSDYIYFIDSDDKLIPNIKSKFDDCLSYNFDLLILNEFINCNTSKLDLVNYVLGYGDSKCLLSAPYCKIFSTNIIMNNNVYFDTNLMNGEDMIFVLQNVLLSKNIIIKNEKTYMNRIHLNSSTRKFNPKIIKNDIYFQDKLQHIVEETKLIENISDLIDFKKIDGIFTVLKNISYNNSFISAKKNFKLVDCNKYIITSKNNLINKKKYLVYKLFLKRKYLIIYLIFKIYLSKNKKSGRDEFFIEI